jgi:hypothetical protein
MPHGAMKAGGAARDHGLGAHQLKLKNRIAFAGFVRQIKKGAGDKAGVEPRALQETLDDAALK